MSRFDLVIKLLQKVSVIAIFSIWMYPFNKCIKGRKRQRITFILHLPQSHGQGTKTLVVEVLNNPRRSTSMAEPWHLAAVLCLLRRVVCHRRPSSPKPSHVGVQG
jgi:hypothetical protein